MEAFLRMYRAHARFDPDGNFGGWARRIATNLALDHLRKSRREAPLTIDPEDSRADARTGGDAAERREIRDAVARAMSELPPKLRVVATLALVEERSLSRDRRSAGNFGRRGAGARISSGPIAAGKTESIGSCAMNEQDDRDLREFVKRGLAPMQTEPRRDLWPRRARAAGRANGARAVAGLGFARNAGAMAAAESQGNSDAVVPLVRRRRR